MTLLGVATLLVSCAVSNVAVSDCWQEHAAKLRGEAQVAGTQVSGPVFQGESVDVVLTAQAALVWDEKSGQVLYERASDEQRPVASLSKLLSALAVRELMPITTIVEIPAEIHSAQFSGANIKLPIGEHTTVGELLASGLIASANDAMVALAVASAGSEDAFVDYANSFAERNGFYATNISNATGLPKGQQYSTAHDIRKLFSLVYHDQVLRNMLARESGVLRTQEGTVRQYKSTNKLLGTYFPVLAAKTGYTPEAGENLVVMTYGDNGQRIGAVVLGSTSRFQDMKTLVEWVRRNFNWQ